ncbi:hypothetical protein SAMN04489712_14617 [Thermomonospora echinospora]|uniref:Uncharacterized protein n=1 Tax=Thermomonospora echinospora TaxID=1992 RepID=A0A1H6E9G6_9ACTN|nr:hypothetical protein [Thermomonospora echinospora]SEG94332.1 hypothetical protein SAMN04489712_14617 [Thermomonospora echinospora]
MDRFLPGLSEEEVDRWVPSACVLWMRMLDRLHGPHRPRLVVIDPRVTPVAREADVHLAARPGANVNQPRHPTGHRSWLDRQHHCAGY